MNYNEVREMAIKELINNPDLTLTQFFGIVEHDLYRM